MPHAYLAKAKYKRQTQPTPDHSHHGEPIAASLALPDGVTVSRTALVCCSGTANRRMENTRSHAVAV